MFEINLIYNPYLVETVVEINNERLGVGNDLVALTQKRRLQDWINLFPEKVVEVFREKQFKINARCTEFDAVDIEHAVVSFNKNHEADGFHVSLNCCVTKKASSARVDELRELFAEAQGGPFPEFQEMDLRKQFEDALSPDFEVNIIATMSSGKSTVLNAIIGKELLPEKNEACTATMAFIKDSDGMQSFQGYYLDSTGTPLSEWQDVNREKLTKWNDSPKASVLEIKGDILSIQETPCARLVLVDTPGPNNSRDETHRQMTVDAIHRKPLSMVLYVLNATQLNIDDDASLLKMVAKAMNTGGRQANDRFIFIVNKIDAFDTDKGESVAGAIENARKYLVENGIESPTIIPASARLAKLIRMARNGDELTRKQKIFLTSNTEIFLEEDELNLLTHVKDVINPLCYGRLAKKVDSANETDKAEILSGIPIVEEMLNDFLNKHAIPAKIKDAVDTFHHVAQKAEVEEGLQAQLSKGEAELTDAIKSLEAFEKKLQGGDVAKKFKEKVTKAKYKESDAVYDEYVEIQDEMEDILAERAKDFAGVVKPLEAVRMIDSTKSKLQSFNSNIHTIITKALEDDFVSRLDTLKIEYEKYISQLLENEFPSKEDFELSKLQSVTMEMPDAVKLAADFTEEVEVGSHEVSTSKWYNPFSWGSTKTIKEYGERVDMQDVWKKMERAFRDSINLNIKKSKDIASENAEKSKRLILNAMDGIDEALQQNIEKMRLATNDKATKERLLAESREKADWYKNFSAKLDEVLSI